MRIAWPVAIGAAILFVAVGAVSSYIVMRPAARSSAPSVSSPATTASPTQRSSAVRAADGPLPDVIVTLTDETIRRAGIEVATVQSGPMASVLRLPAVVEPNAYKQVIVTPLVSGRITRVLSELGTQVRQGETMAIVFSPELAEAQTRFIAASADLEAHERELARTEKLAQIGPASRQELERAHAEHTSKRTSVDSARTRLELLGLSHEAVDSLAAGRPVNANTDVPAPISGVVTERNANVGLNVEPSVKLFSVVDLSTVWIVANLYEQDFARVRLGDRATIVSSAYPDLRLQGSVNYIDPQVSRETRTANVRIDVANPRRELRLGMLAEAQLEGTDRKAATFVPKAAVQNIAARSFVYLSNPDAPTQFVEREVRLGSASGERIEVLSGLMPGDRVVIKGSFYLRAERERLGLRVSASG